MNMSVVEIIKLGQKYMKLWPNRPELANYFAEYKTVQFARIVCAVFPALAVISAILPLYFGIAISPSQIVFYFVFILSMPVQALVMLGVKADKFLSPSLATWYKEGVAKVNEQGGDIKLSVHKPKYYDLAQLLNITYSSLSSK